MKITSPELFNEYTCYKVFHKKMGRWQICLVHNETKRKKTLLYSKFLMSCHVNRLLRRDEEVDHINHDKSDDRIENLQILTKHENLQKQASTMTKRMISLECPECRKIFTRSFWQTHHGKAAGLRTFCSRQCSYDFMRTDS